MTDSDSETEAIYDRIPESVFERRELIWWLKDHPLWRHPQHKLSEFHTLVWIDLAYVNPEDNIVSDDRALNIKPEIWIEAGPYVDTSQWEIPHDSKWVPSHDVRLDCGGDSLEEALCNLAVRVRHYYGDTGDI